MSDAGTSDGTGSTSTGAASRVEGVGRVEFGQTDSFLVCQPLAAGAAERVRDRIDERRPAEESGTARLLPGDDVVTASLFLTERDGGSDALVWYVEVEGGGAWADPAATLARRTPLYEGIEERLAGPARLRGDAERVIHATNPARPSRPGAADVVLVRLDVEPGIGTWLARFVAGLVDGLEGTWVGRTLRASAGEVIEDERMWTETLFLDRTDGEYALLWYMEADDMDRVTEVYETTDNRVARWSEVAFEHMVGSPLAALGDPMGASEYELLAHETNPARR